MANDRMDVSDKTAISMPMRNLLSILAAVGIGVYAFFGIQERLNNVETRSTLMEADLTKNTEFSRGFFFLIEQKEMLVDRQYAGVVITPMDTHLMASIIGLYFGGSLVKK